MGVAPVALWLGVARPAEVAAGADQCCQSARAPLLRLLRQQLQLVDLAAPADIPHLQPLEMVALEPGESALGLSPLLHAGLGRAPVSLLQRWTGLLGGALRLTRLVLPSPREESSVAIDQ
jgi:hypothetical protein